MKTEHEKEIQSRSKEVAKQVAKRFDSPRVWENRVKELQALSLYRIANALEDLADCTGEDSNSSPRAAKRYLNIDGCILNTEQN